MHLNGWWDLDVIDRLKREQKEKAKEEEEEEPPEEDQDTPDM